MPVHSCFAFVDAGSCDHRGLGLAIGEHLREPIRGQCARALATLCAHAQPDRLGRVAQTIRATAAAVFPHYLEEIDGMAAGAAVDPRHLLLAGNEEPVMNAVRERCTSIAFSAPGCIALGHNEDWAPGYEESLYVVRATLPDGLTMLSLAYIGTLPGSSVALNSHGIAFTGNSILDAYRPGLVKNLILRSQIEARSLGHFERLAARGPRAIPNNTMAVDRRGAMVNIELALDRHAVITGDDAGVMVHTNHVLAPELQELETRERPCSRARFAAAHALTAARPLSTDLMRQVLRSHAGWPHSICLHAKSDHYDDAQTVASAIVDLDAMTLAVAKGPPCRHGYTHYALAG